MEKPLASGPPELFARIDDESVVNAQFAESEGIVFTTLDTAINWAPQELHLADELRTGVLRH